MAGRSARRPTLADVASRSSVSTATVSYVLNATPGQTISAATRARVRAAAAELGYVPSASAQALARGRSKVVVIDMSGIPLTGPVIDGRDALVQAFEDGGFIPVVHQLSRPRDPHGALLTLAQALTPAAVLSGTPLPDGVRAQLGLVGVDCVLSMLTSADDVAAMIAAGTREQLQHLHDRGHRVVAYVPGDPGEFPEMAALRRSTMRDEAAVLGIDLRELAGSADPAELAVQLELVLATDPRPTAAAAYSDQIAAAVLSAAHRLGWRVPDDLAVIGLTDAPIAPLTWPALTSVRFTAGPSAVLPRQFVEAVINRSTALGARNLWRAEIVQREST